MWSLWPRTLMIFMFYSTLELRLSSAAVWSEIKRKEAIMVFWSITCLAQLSLLRFYWWASLVLSMLFPLFYISFHYNGSQWNRYLNQFSQGKKILQDFPNTFALILYFQLLLHNYFRCLRLSSLFPQTCCMGLTDKACSSTINDFCL